jgi:hypothetical protein
LKGILLDCERARCEEGNILTWEPKEKFDRIFCISVLEHVEGNVLIAIDRMRSWLTDRGRLILTMDVGLPGGVYGFPIMDCREIAAHCGVSVPNPDVKTLVSSSDFEDSRYVGSDIGIFYLVLNK